MKNAQIVQIEKIKLLFVLNGEIQKKVKRILLKTICLNT